jgi:CubicO group peptidase (beta-lactamase class C family)
MGPCIKFALMAIIWSGSASVLAQKRVQLLKNDVVPGAEWQKAMPESLGYSSKKLEALRQWVGTQDTASMMVVVQGRVVFYYGDVTHPSKIASARKSVLGMLYGKYVQNGAIDLDKTVKQLGLDDKEAFLPIEETATLRQLLAALSGVYLPTSSFERRAIFRRECRKHPERTTFTAIGTLMRPGPPLRSSPVRIATTPAAAVRSSACNAGLSTFAAGEGTRSADQMA